VFPVSPTCEGRVLTGFWRRARISTTCEDTTLTGWVWLVALRLAGRLARRRSHKRCRPVKAILDPVGPIASSHVGTSDLGTGVEVERQLSNPGTFGEAKLRFRRRRIRGRPGSDRWSAVALHHLGRLASGIFVDLRHCFQHGPAPVLQLCSLHRQQRFLDRRRMMLEHLDRERCPLRWIRAVHDVTQIAEQGVDRSFRECVRCLGHSRNRSGRGGIGSGSRNPHHTKRVGGSRFVRLTRDHDDFVAGHATEV